MALVHLECMEDIFALASLLNAIQPSTRDVYGKGIAFHEYIDTWAKASEEVP